MAKCECRMWCEIPREPENDAPPFYDVQEFTNGERRCLIRVFGKSEKCDLRLYKREWQPLMGTTSDWEQAGERRVFETYEELKAVAEKWLRIR